MSQMHSGAGVSPLPLLTEIYCASGQIGAIVWAVWGILIVLMVGLDVFFN